MSKYQERKKSKVTFPITDSLQKIPTEEIVLVLEGRQSIDLGAICYLDVSEGRRNGDKGKDVDFSSFNKDREKQVRKLIDQVILAVHEGGFRAATLATRYNSLCRFINWCDRHNYSNVLENVDSGRIAFKAYVENLKTLVYQNQTTKNSAAIIQNAVLICLEKYFGKYDLDRGINKILIDKYAFNSTAVPSQEAQERLIAWCECLFKGLSTLVLDFRPFPFALEVPGYIGWPNNQLWVFPVTQWCLSPPFLKLNPDIHRNPSYDYANGNIRSFDESYPNYLEVKYKHQVRKAYEVSINHIKQGNENQYDKQRLQLGIIAAHAFVKLFIAITGGNPSAIYEIRWDEEIVRNIYNPELKHQGIRTVKFRAGDREVSYNIEAKYAPLLKKYVSLRDYVLQGKPCDYLFFGFGVRRDDGIPRKLGMEFHGRFSLILARICPDLDLITNRELRAAKQDYVIRNHTPNDAASVMQTTLETQIKNYSNGSQTSAEEELSSYLRSVDMVVDAHTTYVNGESRALGLCSDKNHPSPIDSASTIQPDCRKAEGCLFCDKYRVHADETDIRKLFSAKFCISQVSGMATSAEEYDRVFGLVIKRIDAVVEEIRKTGTELATLVSTIDNEVNRKSNRKLDPYWDSKLEEITDMGFI